VRERGQAWSLGIDGTTTDPSARRPLSEITLYFLRLGALGFGGRAGRTEHVK